MPVNESCTLFLKDGNGFTRYYVPRCHFQESVADSVTRSGLQGGDGLTVYIFSRDIDEELTETLKQRRNAAQDIIVAGECDFTFDGTTQQSASESMKTLLQEYDAHTVMKIERLLYGSPHMQHFKIIAR